MTKEKFLSEVASALPKLQVQRLASVYGKSSETIGILIDQSFNPDPQLAFRAAWILETVSDIFPEQFASQHLRFLQVFPMQNNPSCRRHFTKIMMEMTVRDDIKSLTAYHEVIVETAFKWLIDPMCPVAVKVNCLDVIYNLRDSADWIRDELEGQISFLMKEGSAAIVSRGRKLLKKISVEKKKNNHLSSRKRSS